MSKAWLIAKRDFRSYFTSPIAYLVLAGFLAVTAWMFVSGLYYFEQGQMNFMGGQKTPSLTDYVIVPLYSNMSVVLLFIVPFITMRLFSEERKMHTLELLMTSPVGLGEIVLGKFMSAALMALVLLGSALIFPISLFFVAKPDIGPIIGANLGLFLMLMSYAAVGILYSAMTENQIISGSLSIATILLFWIVSWIGQAAGPVASDVIEYISLITHYRNFSLGAISSPDVIFYLSFSGFFLFLTHRVLDSYRWR